MPRSLITGSNSKAMFQLYQKLLNCFAKWLSYFALPPGMEESCPCFTFGPSNDIVNFLDFRHADGSVVVCHC